MILFLMFFSVSISNSEIGGPHVCTIKIPYSDEVRVSDIQRYDVVEFSWQSLRFKLVNKFIPVVKTQKVDKLRTVLQCCFGYTWNVYLNKCIPYCSNGCVHGNCTAPEICECYGNFGGLTCNFSCPLGFYGSICNNKCLCKNNATCDAFNGKCRCLEGWRGQYCDRPCRFGNYGKNCLKTCRCDHGNCDPTYGRCKCHSGWTGTFCNSLSQDGCICHNHGSCDINNGTCSPGWFGTQCEKKIEPECQGSHCSENCICFNGTCNGNDTLGMCGCPRGFTGNMCANKLPHDSHESDSIVYFKQFQPAMFAILILIITLSIVLIIACRYYKKRNSTIININMKNVFKKIRSVEFLRISNENRFQTAQETML